MVIDEEIEVVVGCKFGFIGLVNLLVFVVVDCSVVYLVDFICGVNKDDFYLIGVNWECDFFLDWIEDLCDVVEGDLSFDGQGYLEICWGIEVGYIFKFGNKYSSVMNVIVFDENGKSVILEMGCYGIGVLCIVVVFIEQNYDDKGIIWFDVIVLFQVVIVILNGYKLLMVVEVGEKFYEQL